MKSKTILSCIMILSLINTLFGKGLEVGQPAPQLNATIETGDTINLGEVFSSGTTLVFFYPKADTPGCTAQACSLRDSFEELTAKGIEVFGVSYDSASAQSSFIEKYELPYHLVADKDKAVSKAFGRGAYSRQAYLIQDGVIIWRDLNASTRSQAADVKQALMDLGIHHFDSMK